MYYSFMTNTLFTEKQLAKTGINFNNKDLLKNLQIVEVESIIPEVDAKLYDVVNEGINIDQDTGKVSIKYSTVAKDSTMVLSTLKSYLKEKRINVEQGGIVINSTNTVLDSTRVDGQMIHNSYVGLSTLMPDAVIDFYSASGWVTITVDALQSVFMLYSNHVDDCFKREKAINDLLDSAETSEEAIEIFNNEINNGWPTYA